MKLLLFNFSILIVFLFLCLQFLISLTSLQNTFWHPQDLRINIVSGNLYVSDLISQQFLIRIAPYQDFYYLNGRRESLNGINIMKPAFPQIDLHQIFFPNSWNWQLPNRQISYSYNFNFTATTINLTRSVSGTQENISDLGQSIFYCPTCVIVNPQTNLVYYYFQDPNSPLFQNARSLNYQPHQVPGKLINEVNMLEIINLKNGRKIIIDIPKNSIAILEDSDNILEIRTPVIKNGDNLQTTQKIEIPYE